MKLIVAVVRDEISEAMLNALVEQRYAVTRVASTGGFLRRGNTTLWIGTEDQRLEQALETIRAACAGSIAELGEGKASVFVLNVARFEQL